MILSFKVVDNVTPDTMYMYGLNDSGRLGLTEIAEGGKRGHEDIYQPRPVNFPGNSKVVSFSCGHSGRYCCLEIEECSNQMAV